jgi:phospho-N-acetylmuramoyl-pentapeptide-transferase
MLEFLLVHENTLRLVLEAVIWIAAGFVISALCGFIILKVSQPLDLKQTAYEDAPQTHRQKTGTPTMGGISFVVAMLPLLAGVYSSESRWPFAGAMLFLVWACAAIGFIDDFLGIRRGKNQGLRASTKYLATALVAVIFLRLVSAADSYFLRDVIFHAGGFVLLVPHWLWLLLGILAITGTVHAVNLTDGLDGLATGAMIPPLAAFAAIALFGTGQRTPAHAALLGIGACLGFLLYNRHKAKMFMGDVGSLALGALLSGVAILTGEMLLLVIAGAVFVAEALSVIVQVAYFKATKGKRIFRMSPLHHHFELGGMPETTVTPRFWLASVLCSALAWAIAR